MKQIRLTISSEIPIIDEGDGYYASIDVSFWNDWTVKIQWFEEGYDEANTVLGNTFTPLFSLFIYAVCPRCNKRLDDDHQLDMFLNEDELLCPACWYLEMTEDYRSMELENLDYYPA